MKKIKLFTHNDLDGLGAAVLCKTIYENVNYKPLGYDAINKEVLDFIKDETNDDKYNLLLITDISVTKETAEIIDKMNKPYKIKLIDHHETALHLENYDWCIIKHKTKKHLHSGTELTYEYLKEISNEKEKEILEQKSIKKFVELVRSWDTWDWEKTNNKKANDLNELLFGMGFFKFVDYEVEKLLKEKEDFQFDKLESILIDSRHEQYKFHKSRYIKSMKQAQCVIDKKIMKYGLVYGSEFISKAANEILKEYTELDFIMSFDLHRGLSIRSIKQDCKVIAKELAELTKSLHGGHTGASGVTIDSEKIFDGVLDIIFSA